MHSEGLGDRGTRALFAVSVGGDGCGRESRFRLASLNNFRSLWGEGLPLVVWDLLLGVGGAVRAGEYSAGPGRAHEEVAGGWASLWLVCIWKQN